MQERVIYLSGPITGHTPDEAKEWRRYVSSRLAPGIVAIDPTRDAAVFSSPTTRQLDDTARMLNLLHGKEILERNRQDLARCDLVLANLLGAPAVSIGSIGEIFWADAMRKPVVLVREPHFNLHDHALINAISCCVVDNLDAALAKINLLLLPMLRTDHTCP